MSYHSLLSAILTECGLLLSRFDTLDTTQKFIRRLIKDGFHIETVYDVGAYKGDWTRRLKTILPGANFYLFEANKEHEIELSATGSKYFLEVLSSSEEKLKWWSISGTGDSLFRENHVFYQEIEPVIRSTRTLDSLIAETNLPLPNLIKIDVQGGELEVLKGGKNSVKDTAVIILEIPIVEYNAGAPNISEYLAYMKAIGFLPLDVLEVHHSDGLLVQIDIGFAKKCLITKNYNTEGAFYN